MKLYDLYNACADMDCTHKVKLIFSGKVTLVVTLEEAIYKYGHLTVLCFFKDNIWYVTVKEKINNL